MTVVHVYPVDDLVDHQLDPDCPCLPTVDAVACSDGSTGQVVGHHALDGREDAEADQPNCASPGWMVTPSDPTGAT